MNFLEALPIVPGIFMVFGSKATRLAAGETSRNLHARDMRLNGMSIEKIGIGVAAMRFRTLMLTGIALVGFAAPAAAKSTLGAVTMVEASAALAPNQFAWADAPAADKVARPVSVVISIPDQRAYVYRGETLIAVSSVSTGRDDKETPAGVYPILQKEVTHKSNLYDAAPMPYMQRLTWDGIALHAGRNPGFPDSHGCIRLPTAFAKRLFAVTELGSTVTVIDSSIGGGEGDDASLVPYEIAQRAQQEAARGDADVRRANADQFASYQ